MSTTPAGTPLAANVSPSFKATYNTTCCWCGDAVVPGHRAAYLRTSTALKVLCGTCGIGLRQGA